MEVLVGGCQAHPQFQQACAHCLAARNTREVLRQGLPRPGAGLPPRQPAGFHPPSLRRSEGQPTRPQAFTALGPRVFIASPFRGLVTAKMIAQEMCREAFAQGLAPYAPHLLYPDFLDDNSLAERTAGIRAGLSFLEACDRLWFYCPPGHSPSEGMLRELHHAVHGPRPIPLFRVWWGSLDHPDTHRPEFIIQAECSCETLEGQGVLYRQTCSDPLHAQQARRQPAPPPEKKPGFVDTTSFKGGPSVTCTRCGLEFKGRSQEEAELAWQDHNCTGRAA